VFEHDFFDVYPFAEVPLERDCYLMDERYLHEYEAWLLNCFEGNGRDPIGYVAFVAGRQIHEHSIDLSWYPNVYDRFHEVTISLPKSQFVTCVGSWRYDEKPHIFVKSDWLQHLYLRSNSIFCMVDAIGIKDAIRDEKLSRQKLVDLRERIDGLAENYPSQYFISFADSLLVKSNWTAGHFQSDVSYTYHPEVFVEIVKELQGIYRQTLGLGIYAVFAQGANKYYEDSLVHASPIGNHISLNSLGIPFAQIFAIETSARNAIKDGRHEPSELYLDALFFRSLQFRHGFETGIIQRYDYPAPMLESGSQYYVAKINDILENIEQKE